MNFECHITTTVAAAGEAERIALIHGWKTSEIKRDPVLGDGSHFYLTAHSHSYSLLLAKMHMTTAYLRNADCVVLREKIELIMYDTKTGEGL